MEHKATVTRDCPCNFRTATSFRLEAWQEALAGHAIKQFVQYLLTGINKGFNIGAKMQSAPLKSEYHNMQTVGKHTELITAHIEDKVHAGRLLGPLPLHLLR